MSVGNDLLAILALPFMQRALIAGVLLGALLAVLGVFATLRRMAFFGEGIAHASLAGVAIASLAGAVPLPVALAWSVGVAIIMFVIEKNTRLPRDTVLGILFTTSMALGVVIMSRIPGYQPELLNYLFGSILGISNTDIVILAVATAAILAGIALSFRSLVLLSLNEDAARVAGIRANATTLALYCALAIAMVLGAKMLGIILVSALLIIPAATARVLAGSLKQFVALAIIVAEIAVLTGIFLSYVGDLPPGSAIVLAAAVFFGLSVTYKA